MQQFTIKDVHSLISKIEDLSSELELLKFYADEMSVIIEYEIGLTSTVIAYREDFSEVETRENAEVGESGLAVTQLLLAE